MRTQRTALREFSYPAKFKQIGDIRGGEAFHGIGRAVVYFHFSAVPDANRAPLKKNKKPTFPLLDIFPAAWYITACFETFRRSAGEHRTPAASWFACPDLRGEKCLN